MTRIKMFALTFGALFGAQLHAATWIFQDTVLQGTFSGTATVNGFITVNGLNFDFPVDITLTGPFGTFTDLGSGLQLDEGSGSFADTNVDFLVQQLLSTPGLTVDPLTSFTFTSVFPGSQVTDTYSLSTGELVMAPEPGTGAFILIGGLALSVAILVRRRRCVSSDNVYYVNLSGSGSV
jgi:hypothetical protein